MEQRLRNFCNSRNLDDELHFLIKCEFHTNARKTFYLVLDKNICNFESLPDDDKFRAILTSPKEDVIFSLGKFIHDGFKSRELFQRNSLWNIFNTGFNFIVLMLNLPVNISFFSFSYYFRKKHNSSHCVRYFAGVIRFLSFYLLLFYICMFWLMGQPWPVCVNKNYYYYCDQLQKICYTCNVFILQTNYHLHHQVFAEISPLLLRVIFFGAWPRVHLICITDPGIAYLLDLTTKNK